MKIKYQYPYFVDLIQPNGHLVRDKACHACWYFYALAEKARRTVGNSIDDQIILEDQLWMNKEYTGIAWGVVKLYQLESPDDFQKYWPLIEQQAKALDYPPPHQEYKGRIRFIT